MTAAVTPPVAIKIDPEIKERMKRLADARHRTPHWLMRKAINQYVEREEKREAFWQDTLNAWEECCTTGLHATAEEVAVVQDEVAVADVLVPVKVVDAVSVECQPAGPDAVRHSPYRAGTWPNGCYPGLSGR